MSFDAAAQFPETFRYRLKNKLLGPPLVSEQLTTERLGRPIALGVLAPDCISSSAYGTEETLTQLVPAIGLAAFALVVPIMIAILGVLFFVTLSYLEVIQRYTKAGGAYVVARDNFGPDDRPGRRGRAADRLHGDRRGADRRRHRRADERVPETGALHRSHLGRCRPRPRLRQPARHPRGREAVRLPHLLLRDLADRGDRGRLRERRPWATCTRTRCRPRICWSTGASATRAAACSWGWPSSHSCGPSPTVGRR